MNNPYNIGRNFIKSSANVFSVQIVFIPRGLFHDLMDGADDEGFDNIQGHSILQIYNRFNDLPEISLHFQKAGRTL